MLCTGLRSLGVEGVRGCCGCCCCGRTLAAQSCSTHCQILALEDHEAEHLKSCEFGTRKVRPQKKPSYSQTGFHDMPAARNQALHPQDFMTFRPLRKKLRMFTLVQHVPVESFKGLQTENVKSVQPAFSDRSLTWWAASLQPGGLLPGVKSRVEGGADLKCSRHVFCFGACNASGSVMKEEPTPQASKAARGPRIMVPGVLHGF